MRSIFFIVVISGFFFSFIHVCAQEKMRVVSINPGFSDVANPTGGFWVSVSSFMKAAAADLNIELEILYCDRNHIKRMGPGSSL